MTDVSLAGAFLAGLVSFLSPCVLPLVPGYISMLSGIGMEQLRQGQVPRSGLFSSALAFVTGFSVVFISFGATASAVGSFLKENRHLLIPIAGALILLFGLHLLGLLIKLSLRAGAVLGALFLILAGRVERLSSGICVCFWVDAVHRANPDDGSRDRGGERQSRSRCSAVGGVFLGPGHSLPADSAGHQPVHDFL